ncbi:MAG: hypothetical protein AMXMBFR8_05720 [Nevskiales bacterium]
MARRIVFLILLCVLLVVALAFAALNSGPVTVNLGWIETTMQKPLLLAVVFAMGWLFGLLCLGLVMLRLALERRRLRRALRLAEAEVNTLRSVPTANAD